MKHFYHMKDEFKERTFEILPQHIDRNSEKNVIAKSLGATLYMPGVRPTLTDDILKQYRKGCSSVVICLEDSIRDEDVEIAEQNLVKTVKELSNYSNDETPFVFIRVRNPEHLEKVAGILAEDINTVNGFSLPKFDLDENHSLEYAHQMKCINKAYSTDSPIYYMPIIESPRTGHIQTRYDNLFHIKNVLDDNKEEVLAVRMGVTDLSSVYGIRRSSDTTIYNIGVIANVIYDIVNVFGQADDGYTITGPVWEHFVDDKRLFKPQLRTSPFLKESLAKLRTELIIKNLDAFIKEITLDKANGITGKTVIHPSHVNIVNALQIVTLEEYEDAKAVLTIKDGGVLPSANRNKMNEGKPHYNWAVNTLQRAQAYGVMKNEVELADILKYLISE